MKALNDSCYVVPEKNHRVIQDTNLVKHTAYKAALNKYEEQVSMQKSANEKFIHSHYDSIVKEKQKMEREETTKRDQVSKNTNDIRSQMDERVSIFSFI